MKVIGAGFGRTGTLSLKAALEKLGFGPCYHMTELFDKPDHVAFWEEAVEAAGRGEPAGWEEVFSGYEATVDWPGCVFYAEIMQAYPEAKVLLSVRDPEGWYDSVQSTFARMPDPEEMSPARRLFFEAGKLLAPGLRRGPSMVGKVIHEYTFGGRLGDREHATSVFEIHVGEVKRRVPEGRLLVFDVKEGWGPLCRFFGVEEPEEPFPHLNERGEFSKVMVAKAARAFVPSAGKAATVALILLAAAWALRSPGPRLRGR